MKLCDSREGLVLDKQGVNSSVNLSLQGGYIDRAEVKGLQG